MFDVDDDSQGWGSLLRIPSLLSSIFLHVLGNALLCRNANEALLRTINCHVALTRYYISLLNRSILNTNTKSRRHPIAVLPHLSIILDQIILSQHPQSILLHFLLPLTLRDHPTRGERRHRCEWHIRTVRCRHARANPGFQMCRSLQDCRLRRWSALKRICIAEGER